LRILEAHNGLTGLIVEKTSVQKEGINREFNGIWIFNLIYLVNKFLTSSRRTQI